MNHSKPLEQSNKKIILYQGALNKGRGIEECINAMKNFPTLEFHIAGEGDLSQELRTLVVELGLDKQVKFLGFIRPDELRSITQTAWLGINVLKADSLNYYYSLANKFFDYMQAGVPHISMNFPEYKRINEHTEIAVLIDDLDTTTIISAIQDLLDHEAYYLKLRQNCLKGSDIYLWENEGKKLIDLYKKLTEFPR